MATLLVPPSPVPLCSRRLTLAVTFSEHTRAPAIARTIPILALPSIAFTIASLSLITIITIDQIIMMMSDLRYVADCVLPTTVSSAVD